MDWLSANSPHSTTPSFSAIDKNNMSIINDEEKIIQIFYIGRRKNIYEQFRKLLTGFE